MKESINIEKSIKWGSYFLIGWIVFILGVAWVVAISFNIDPFGFNSDQFQYRAIAILTVIAVAFWYVTTRIIGEIFDIKYYKLFKLNPFPSGEYWMEIWKNSSPLGKFLQFLIIPEILFLIYLAITNNELLSGLWLPLFVHIWLLYKVCGTQIGASYRKRYGKEMGDAMYKATYTTIKQTPNRLGARLLNFKFILFILIVNPLEVLIIIYLLNGLFQRESANTYVIVLFSVITIIAIQDLIVLDKLNKKSK